MIDPAPIDGEARDILCVMRLPPNPAGHGGAQRAWFLVEALRRYGPVHFLLLHREDDRDLDTISLDPLRRVAASVTVIALRDWTTFRERFAWLPWSVAIWLDLAIKGSGEAPRIGTAECRSIAEHLPRRRFAMIFAGRLPTAVIAQRLLDLGLIAAPRRLVDFDDVLSQFKRRQLAADASASPARRLLQHLDIRLVERAERRIAARWDAVSVCKRADVDLLAGRQPGGRFVVVPNVVDRPLLPPRAGTGFRLLFIGNLGFPPNVQGLDLFLAQAWPRIRAARADVTLTVVGLAPDRRLARRLATTGVMLHADVVSVEPFYRDCDAVICPILVGGGTRIKILEATAYGRPVISTVRGAEGLGLVDGEHALLGETVADLAALVLRIADDPGLGRRLATAARALQDRQSGPAAMQRAIDGMIAGAINDG